MAHLGRRRNGEPPPYLHHKKKNLAYVNLRGKLVYLGPYGSQESRQKYRDIVQQWEAQAAPLPPPKPGCTITELVAAHARHAQVYYRRDDGTPTSEVASFRKSLSYLLAEPYGEMTPDEFRPAHLKAIREQMIAAKYCRKTINQHIGRIKRLFSWGVSEELVPESVVGTLSMVRDLAPGRSAAHDNEPIAPAPMEDVEKVLAVVHPILAAMIRIQLLAGPRPVEVCRMRAEEIDRDGVVKIGQRRIKLPGNVWVFQPTQYKQKHAGKIVARVLGSRAQAVLLPFLGARPDGGFLFSARQVVEDTRAEKRKHARTPIRAPYRRKKHPMRKPGECWTRNAYDRAIRRACIKAGVKPWAPNQLRHFFLTHVSKLAGIVAASTMVGHAHIATSEVYVERDLQQAAKIAMEHG